MKNLLLTLLLFAVSAHAQLVRLGPTGTQVTGVLGAANGGTQQSSYTLGDILYASGATALSKLNVGGADAFLQGGATPSWETIGICGDATHALGYNTATHAFTCQAITGSGGTVTSVASNFTGGLISVGGSPVTTTGTLALTVAGTSGGVPYFSGATTWTSSGALTANLPVIGGGAGAAPSSGTRTGNTTQFATSTGAQTSGDCVSIDGNGNHIAFGVPCGPVKVYSCGATTGTTTCANTAGGNTSHVVIGYATLAAGTAVISSISPAFTSTATYSCVGQDQTTVANSVNIVPASASSITITGILADVVSYICSGY